jgi:Flp pilus assembly protein TadD
MGNFLYFAGRITEATQAYRQAAELAPDNATTYNNLGSSYYLLGDFENAAAAWNKSLALAPSTSAYMNLGSSYFFTGRFSDAASMYRTASELSPDDYEVWGSLGDALTQAGGTDDEARQSYLKAIELGEKMLAINASDAQMMATLSQYHARLGNVERAMELVSQAEALQPQNMYVHYFSAVTYAATGKTEAALDAIERAVNLGYPITLLAVDAGLSAVAADGRFRALIRQDAGQQD